MMQNKKNILIIGAGATGQVYGSVLKNAGAQVSYYVRQEYIQNLKEGTPLYQLKNRRYQFFSKNQDYTYYSSSAPFQQKHFDFIFLCVSGPAIRGAWLKEFLSHFPKSPIVSIQPGLEDEEYLLSIMPKNRLIHLSVSFICFRVPLDLDPKTASLNPGFAFFLPLLSQAFISGDIAETSVLMRLLNEGKLKTIQVLNAKEKVAIPDVFLNLLVFMFQKSNASLDELLNQPVHLKMLSGATKEAVHALSIKGKRSANLAPLLANPLFFKLLIYSLRKLSPFKLDSFLISHFGRKTDQTLCKVQYYQELCQTYQIDSKNLSQILAMN